MEAIEATSKITSKGQITIPIEIRKALGLRVGDRLRFILNKEGNLTIEPIKYLTADELCGILNKPEDNGNFELKELFFNSLPKYV